MQGYKFISYEHRSAPQLLGKLEDFDEISKILEKTMEKVETVMEILESVGMFLGGI